MYEGTQFLCVKFRLGSAGEPTICSHCYSVPYMKIPANNQVFIMAPDCSEKLFPGFPASLYVLACMTVTLLGRRVTSCGRLGCVTSWSVRVSPWTHMPTLSSRDSWLITGIILMDSKWSSLVGLTGSPNRHLMNVHKKWVSKYSLNILFCEWCILSNDLKQF